MVELTPDQHDRYDRHLRLPGFDAAAQARVLAARVCVVGAGGLGAPVLLYLAGAGVGTLGIVDVDALDASNLHRQIIHDEAGVGGSKVASAATRVRGLNASVTVREHEGRLDAETAREVLAGYDIVVDAADNFVTRYLLSDVCAELGIPLVWGAVLQTRGQISVFTDGITLRDLTPEPPAQELSPPASQVGVWGPLCGQVGAIMAGEALKLITGVGRPLVGRVLVVDAFAATQHELPLRPRGDMT